VTEVERSNHEIINDLIRTVPQISEEGCTEFKLTKIIITANSLQLY